MDVNIPGMGSSPNIEDIINQVKDRIDFPASKEKIIEAVNGMDTIPDQAKIMIADKFPDKQYDSIDDVKSAIGL